MKTHLVLLGLAFVPASAPAAPGVGPAPVTWQGVEWRLSELNGAKVRVVNEQRRPTLTLSAGVKGRRAFGTAGCNRFTGSYTVSGASLKLGPLVATRLACPDGMELETAFLKALATVDGFSAGANVLTLKSGSTVVARFVKAGAVRAAPKPGEVAGVTGVEWRLAVLNGAKVMAESGRCPTLLLEGTARRATGSTGCNRYNGRFTLKGSTLTFSGLAATRKFCPGGMDLEADYLKALGGAKTYRVRDGRLYLLSEGREVAVFDRGSDTR